MEFTENPGKTELVTVYPVN